MATQVPVGFLAPSSGWAEKIGRMVRIGSGTSLLLLVSSAAYAQCAFSGVTPVPGNPANITMGMGSTFAGSIGSAISVANTAFLAQTTAFIASPSGQRQDEVAGGIWIRGIGGRTELSSSGAGTSTWTALPVVGTVACDSTTSSDYAGVQAGVDVGRLSVGNSGTNVHIGVTGGYLSTDNKTITGLDTVKGHFDVPFVGVYAALVSGSGFYIDAQVRRDFYQINISNAAIGLNQGLNAGAWGVTASVGYPINVGGYVIEPSAGIVYSRTDIDPLRFTASVSGFAPMPGILNISDVETLLGRIGVRVATSATLGALAVQPFVAASLWHEFAGDISARYRTTCSVAPALACFSLVPPGGGPIPTNFAVASVTDRVGTFGQFSAGFSASLPQTPWLGYLRADFRLGDNIWGVGLNGGIRYQFAPQS